MGWASGTFGLFGIHAQSVPNPLLNYVGVVLAVIGGLSFAFVKPTLDDTKHGDAIELEEEEGEEEEKEEEARRVGILHKKSVSRSEGSLGSSEERVYILGEHSDKWVS